MSKWNVYLNLGNHSAQWGIWDGEQWVAEGRQQQATPLAIMRQVAEAADAHGLERKHLSSPAACTSAALLSRWCEAVFTALDRPLLVLGIDFQAKINTRYTNPSELGQDRRANLLAAREAGSLPSLILDAGTCLTADIISRQGEHLGGAIAAGLPAALMGILARAPHLLPAAPALPLADWPKGPGLSTAENLALGLALGLVGTTEAMISRLQEMTEQPAPVILTGGDARLLEELLSVPAEVQPYLTLEGVRLAHQASAAAEA